jgi:hypothetical protein
MNNAHDAGEAFAFLTLVPLLCGLAYWVLCAVVSAAIASDKDRSGVGFFFLALLFLGPLAVGVAVLASPGTPRGRGSYEPTGLATNAGDPSLSQAQRSEESAVAGWSPSATDLRPGDRVRVLAPDSKHSGKEGSVTSILSTGYVLVKFGMFAEEPFDPDDLTQIN